MKKKKYESPQLKVKNIRSRQMLCGSYDGALTRMTWSDENGSNWDAKNDNEGSD